MPFSGSSDLSVHLPINIYLSISAKANIIKEIKFNSTNICYSSGYVHGPVLHVVKDSEKNAAWSLLAKSPLSRRKAVRLGHQ